MTTIELTVTLEQGEVWRCQIQVASDELARTVVAQVETMAAGKFAHRHRRQYARKAGDSSSQANKADKGLAVYNALVALSDPSSGWCNHRQVEIAAQAGMSTRHLRRAMTELETLSLINIKRVYDVQERKTRNAYFLPHLAAAGQMTGLNASPSLSAQKEAMMSGHSAGKAGVNGQHGVLALTQKAAQADGMVSAMMHDDEYDQPEDQKPRAKTPHLAFIHEGERQARLAQPHGTPEYLQAWDEWFAAGQFGRLRNPAGWANSQIKKGYWPPPITPTLLSDFSSLAAPEYRDDGEVGAASQEEELWSQVLAQLQLQMSRATFETWLRDTRLLARDGVKFTVAVKNLFARDWLENRLLVPMKRTIAQLVKEVEGQESSPVEVAFVVA